MQRVLIGILLISTLFVGQVISRSSISEYLKIEQDRRQENFLLHKLLTDPNDLNFTLLQVINTGAITVRIRAVYVNDNFICDPSSETINPEGTYINPKEVYWIRVHPTEYLSGSTVSVVTERGIKCAALLDDLT